MAGAATPPFLIKGEIKYAGRGANGVLNQASDREVAAAFGEAIVKADQPDLFALGLRHAWEKVRDWFQDPDNVKLATNILMVVGGTLTILGIALLPATMGGSIAVSLVGGVLVIIGAVLDQTSEEMKKNDGHVAYVVTNGVHVIYATVSSAIRK